MTLRSLRAFKLNFQEPSNTPHVLARSEDIQEPATPMKRQLVATTKRKRKAALNFYEESSGPTNTLDISALLLQSQEVPDLKCKFPPCNNLAPVVSGYCAAHVVGSALLTKEQRREMALFRFKQKFNPSTSIAMDIPLPKLPAEPNMYVDFLPNKKQPLIGKCYWNKAGHKVWINKKRRVRKACLGDLCTKNPSFGNEDDIRPTYCGDHKLKGMMDLIHTRCILCTKRPCFGTDGDSRPTYCGDHMLKGMVDIINIRCLLCKKHPHFGMEYDSRPTYCGDHKLKGMVDIVNIRCLLCTKHPIFGMECDSRPTYCGEHRLKGMVDIISKRCLLCTKQPSFCTAYDSRPTYCGDHRLNGMESIIVRKLCNFKLVSGEACTSQAVSSTSLCTIHQPGYVKTVVGRSKAACRFMDIYEAKQGVKVQHSHYDMHTGKLCGHEHLIHGFESKSGQTKVDGWIASTRTVLEFHGDYYHGNPDLYDRNDRNELVKRTFGELYDKTMTRMGKLEKMGYEVLYIWQKDFENWEKGGIFSQLPIRRLAKKI